MDGQSGAYKQLASINRMVILPRFVKKLQIVKVFSFLILHKVQWCNIKIAQNRFWPEYDTPYCTFSNKHQMYIKPWNISKTRD